MKKLRIILSIILIFNIIASLFCPDEVYAGAGDELSNVAVPYASLCNDYKDAVYQGLSYKDSWFNTDSGTYNHELARMSLGLVMSGFGRSESGEKDLNAKKLLQSLCFDMSSYESTGFEKGDSEDSLAFALCMKTIPGGKGGNDTLLCVVPRSINYGMSGWAGNFTVDGDASRTYHAGFYGASTGIVDRIGKYISDHNIDISSLKIWMCGYSRSAPVIGIVSNRLSLSPLNIPPEHIFTYTFGCANYQTGGDESRAFHIIMPNDVVAHVPFASWDFKKSGTTKVLFAISPVSQFDTKFKKMMEQYNDISSQAGFNDDDYHYLSSETPVINWIYYKGAQIIPDRETYADSFQDLFKDAVLDNINIPRWIQTLSGIDVDGLKKTVADLRIHYEAGNESELKKDINKINNTLDKIISVKGLLKTAGFLDDNKEEGLLLIRDLIRGAKKELDKGYFTTGEEMPNFYLALTLSYVVFDKAPPFLMNKHYPESYLAWMLTDEEKDMHGENESGSKNLIIRGNVDVILKDNEGNTLASIVDESVYSPKDGAVRSALIGTDTRLFTLPLDRDITVSIKANSKGSYEYVIEENLVSMEVSRIIGFESISCTAGQEFTSVFKASLNTYEEEEEYRLKSGDSEIKPDYDVKNDVNTEKTEKEEEEDTASENEAEKVLSENELKRPVYGEDPILKTTVAAKGGLNLSAVFPEVSGKKRYHSADKKLLTVSKKGIARGKKAGTVQVELQAKGQNAYETVSSCEISVVVPVMTEKASASLSENPQLSAFDFLSGVEFAPTEWRSANESVAKVDSDGNITLIKKGKTKIIAVFGKGRLSTGRKYRTKLIVR